MLGRNSSNTELLHLRRSASLIPKMGTWREKNAQEGDQAAFRRAG
jgi:hypothetical protein